MVAEIRVRTRVPAEELDQKVGKVITPGDWNVFLSGPAKVFKPDGRPLAVYLPGVMKNHSQDGEVYDILHSLRTQTTQNRGLASGTLRLTPGTQKRSYSVPIASAIAGAIDGVSIYRFCRLTSWTGENLPQWERLRPMLEHVALHLKTHVPDRYSAQLEQAGKTRPEWVVPGTPFTTITVNNTYPTGVHTDKGDLDAGFSTITCLRRGSYSGGQLCFPEYRIAVDLRDGDLLLMDAHEWHGNAAIVCECGNRLNGCCPECGAERISVVAYYRTKLVSCGSAEEELAKARARREVKVDQ